MFTNFRPKSFGVGNDPFISLDAPNIVFDYVKAIDSSIQGSKTVLCRVYESKGGRGTCSVKTLLPLKQAWISNVLEEDIVPLSLRSDAHTFDLDFAPFKLYCLKIEFQ